MRTLYPPSRPVYVQTKEVLSPTRRVTDILRSDLWTLVTIHPQAPTPLATQEIATSLDPTHELGSWALPFADGPFDLRAFHANPVGYLQARHPAMLTIQCLDHYIPHSMRKPWASL